MRVIHVYPNGAAAIVDTEQTQHSLRIGNQAPRLVLEATEENIALYFPKLEEPEISLK